MKATKTLGRDRTHRCAPQVESFKSFGSDVTNRRFLFRRDGGGTSQKAPLVGKCTTLVSAETVECRL